MQSGDDVIQFESGGNGQKAALTINPYINDYLTPGTRVIKYNGGAKYRVRQLTSSAIQNRLNIVIHAPRSAFF